MIKDEGGSAFPQHPIYSLQEEDGIYDLLVDEQGSGMTLRDYFAAKAMQELLHQYPEQSIRSTAYDISIEAYMLADMMIMTRQA